MSFPELANIKIYGDFSLGDIFSAVLILLICLVAIRILEKLLHRLLTRTKIDARAQKYLLSGVKLLLYIVTVLIVAQSLGVPITSLVALLSVGGLAFSLASEDILANVAGGLVVLSSRPFAIGDFIEVGGVSGTVEEVTLNYTKIDTPAGQRVLIPNKTMSGSQLTNYNTLGRRLVTRKISASCDAPTETVKGACRRALAMTADTLEDPAPSVYLTNYGSSSIEYSVYCWSIPKNYWDVYYALGENLRAAFAESGVEMTYDHLNVHIVENTGDEHPAPRQL